MRNEVWKEKVDVWMHVRFHKHAMQQHFEMRMYTMTAGLCVLCVVDWLCHRQRALVHLHDDVEPHYIYTRVNNAKNDRIGTPP